MSGLDGELARMTGDLATAEDLAQDALVAALDQWPREGVPENPGAWLMAVAKRRAQDRFRRQAVFERVRPRLVARDAPVGTEAFDAVESSVRDDILRLVFVSCHPVLPMESRVVLTLRVVGGLSTAEIARAFFAQESTIAQRISRAKRTLTEAHVPFETPEGAELAARLDAVLEVLYLVFNEGYSATSGEEWVRPELCFDALRLSRVLGQLLPEEPEVRGLEALLEIQASRLRARRGPAGEAVLLMDQDRSHWDQVLIHRGLAAWTRRSRRGAASAPTGSRRRSRPAMPGRGRPRTPTGSA
jgi:RNA polymerase sigma-70 factor, ECF subfamily